MSQPPEKNGQPPLQEWTRPKLVRLGTIADVAGNGNAGPQNGNNGGNGRS